MSLRGYALIVGLAGALGLGQIHAPAVFQGSPPKSSGKGRGNAAREQREARRRRNIAKRRPH